METGGVNNYYFPIGSAANASAQTQTTKAASGDVNKDEFLQLLVAQLKNQDPTDPVKNEDFLAQLATFSSLEQLVAIKEGIDKLAGTITDETQNAAVSSTN